MEGVSEIRRTFLLVAAAAAAAAWNVQADIVDAVSVAYGLAVGGMLR